MPSKSWISLEVTPKAQMASTHFINLEWVRRIQTTREENVLKKLTFTYGLKHPEIVHLEQLEECETFLRLFEEYHSENFFHKDKLKVTNSLIVGVYQSLDDL